MKESLDELYLTWLYSQIGSVKTPPGARTYWSLARQLYQKEFVWFVPNDDNRIEDGKDLRYEFMNDYGLEDVDPQWLDLGCSFLEMLIGLSRRLSFEDDRPARMWFWRLIDNLDLEGWTDRAHNRMAERAIDETLETVIWRTYHHDGRGGMFPLEEPHEDQREVEIWYQLSAYLLEDE